MKLFKILETSFETFDNTVKTYLTKALGAVGQQFGNTQIFSVIFEGIKGVMQNVMFYIEDAFTEQNIETAYRKSSIYSLAKISGYEPFYGTAATGIITAEIGLSNIVNTNKVYIKNGTTLLNNDNGLFYILDIPTDFYIIDPSKPLVSYQFKVVQGVWKSAVYSATGVSNETIHITTSGLYDKEYISVTVDGIKYSPASNIYDMTEDSLEFVVSVGYNNELDIIFGNGIYGKQLSENQMVVIKYLSHNGELGNVLITDNYDFTFKDSIVDSNANTISNTSFIKLKLNSPISGGTNAESIGDVRRMIGYNSRSLVLATENNFKLFFKRFSFIGQSNIWCDNNSLQVNAICLTNYADKSKTPEDYLNAYQNNKLLLSDAQKQMVITTVNNSNKTYAGININFIDPIIYKFGIIAYIKVKNNYDKESVKTELTNIITKYFINIAPNTTFIPKSDIINTVLNNCKYIESIDISFISDMNERGKYYGYYEVYKQKLVNNSTVYIKERLIYTNNDNLGLDDIGNININNRYEIPILSNNISYTIVENNQKDLTTLPAIQFIFI